MPLPPYRVDYSPIIERPRLEWPNGARVALWIAPNIEHYEYLPDYDGVRNPWPRLYCAFTPRIETPLLRGRPPTPFPLSPELRQSPLTNRWQFCTLR